MVRMVLAIASAFLSERRGDARFDEGVAHVRAALQLAEDVLHPGNISGVQALVLLAEYAMVDPQHFDSWGLIGAASRAMTDLGLHQDPPRGAPITRAKLELRRRVFYCIYALDRSTTLAQARAFSFSDDSAQVKVPFDRSLGPAPTSTEQAGLVRSSSSSSSSSSSPGWLRTTYRPALELIRLRQLQSAWYTDLFQSGRNTWDEPYRYLWATCQEMKTWFDNLAPSTTPNMRAFFEMDLLYSYVYVLSPSPHVPNTAPFAQRLVFEYCLRYTDLMLEALSDPTYTSPMTFYDAMRLYMTGRRFLDALQHSPEMLLSGLMPPPPGTPALDATASAVAAASRRPPASRRDGAQIQHPPQHRLHPARHPVPDSFRRALGLLEVCAWRLAASLRETR